MELTACIITCNEIDTLHRSIDKLLTENIKVVVCDNGSRDGTVRKLLDYGTKITKILLPENQGSSIARNETLKHVTTPYYLGLDGDTEYVPNSGKIMVEQLAKLPDDVYALNVWVFNGMQNRFHSDVYASKVGPLRTEVQCNAAYGVSRAEMAKVPYPTHGAFGEPGWGYEDDYRHAQQEAQGRKVVNCLGFKYFHPGSTSRKLLPPALFEQKKAERYALLKADFPNYKQWEERLQAEFGLNWYRVVHNMVMEGQKGYEI